MAIGRDAAEERHADASQGQALHQLEISALEEARGQGLVPLEPLDQRLHLSNAAGEDQRSLGEAGPRLFERLKLGSEAATKMLTASWNSSISTRSGCGTGLTTTPKCTARAEYRLAHVSGGAVPQHELDPRGVAEHLGHELRKEVGAQRLMAAEDEAPLVAALEAQDLRLHLGQTSEDLRGGIEEEPAGLGQGDASAIAEQQRGFQLLFQVLDRDGEGRLTHPQHAGRSADAPLLGDRLEVAELRDVHETSRGVSRNPEFDSIGAFVVPMNDMLKLNARDALKTSTGPVVSPQGGAETEIRVKLQQPEAPAATMPPNALDFSPTELAAVLETASRSARNSASALIGLLAQLEVPTQRVSYYEDLVDKPHHLKAGKDRDLNFTRSSPSILDGIKEETATKLRRELGVKSIGEFAATSAEVLATLVTPERPGQRHHAGTAGAAAVDPPAPRDLRGRQPTSRLGAAREGSEAAGVGARDGAADGGKVSGGAPIALTNSLVRISATFQWLEDCQARLEKLSDEAVVRATKGGAKAVREELDSKQYVTEPVT